MEFRIAPFVLLILGIIVELISLPEYVSPSLFEANGIKFIILETMILFLALGSFYRHDFFDTKQKIVFYVLLAVYVMLWAKYIYQYNQI